jgi:hypothetical protein
VELYLLWQDRDRQKIVLYNILKKLYDNCNIQRKVGHIRNINVIEIGENINKKTKKGGSRLAKRAVI